jgi:hypothetical protein
MRKMAGFPEEAGSFYLPRAEVEPPPALTREIYPEVDEWLTKMAAFRAGSAYNEVERYDLAGSGFLRLLQVLRTVFLQDSVVLRPLFPDHPVWKADVFATDAYRAFATRVTAACEAAEEPGDLQLKKALPVVNDRLNMLQAELKWWKRKATRGMTASKRKSTSSRRTCGSSKRWCAPVKGAPPSALPPPSASAPPIPATLAPNPTAPQVDPSREPFRYKFDRTVTTVPELWNEWSLGRGSGPSIQQLDSAWGAKWRDPTEKQFYHRRLSIIKAIQRRHESGQASSLQEGAVQLEALRTGVHEGMSLNKFNKVLR